MTSNELLCCLIAPSALTGTDSTTIITHLLTVDRLLNNKVICYMYVILHRVWIKYVPSLVTNCAPKCSTQLTILKLS